MKKLLVLSLILFCFQQSQAQGIKKFIKKMYFDKDSTKHSSFVVLPIVTSAPETGLEVGGAGLYSFYADTITANHTRVSNIYPYVSVTTKGQSHFSVSTDHWSAKNLYHYTASVSYINYPFNFYGIGNNTRKADADHVDEKRFKLDVSDAKLVTKNLYAGFVAGAYHYAYFDTPPTGIFITDPQIEDRDGGGGVYIGPSLVFDDRDNNTYTTRGLVINAYYKLMKGVFSNNGYTGGFFGIEYSQFFKLNKNLILGLDIQEQSLTGGSSPFYLLPALGSDEMMRGYYNGRYRERNFIAGQTELRYRISDRIGIVGFLGAGEVAHGSFSASTLKPNYGGGLRYFFDTEKGLSIRADYGIGQKVAGEQRQSGFYIGLGQAF